MTNENGHENVFLRRKPLDAEMFAPYLGMEVEAAVAAIARLRTYWQACTQNPWIGVVPTDDQGLYATLYHDLFFALGQRSDLHTATEAIRELIPDDSPDHHVVLAWSEIGDEVLDAFSRARSILYKLMAAEGKPFGPSDVDKMFDLFDDELEWMAANSRQQAEAEARRLGFTRSSSPAESKPNGQTARAASRRGRKPIELPYADAQRAYWDMADENEHDGERRHPSMQEVCDRLTAQGTRIRLSTFEGRVAKWRNDGRSWPPPRPDLDI